jgi:serine/threonine protein phosphatase PrpC
MGDPLADEERPQEGTEAGATVASGEAIQESPSESGAATGGSEPVPGEPSTAPDRSATRSPHPPGHTTGGGTPVPALVEVPANAKPGDPLDEQPSGGEATGSASGGDYYEPEPTEIEFVEMESPPTTATTLVALGDASVQVAGGVESGSTRITGMGGPGGWDDSDEVRVKRVLIPQVRIAWPESPAPVLADIVDRPSGLDSARLVEALPDLWDTLAEVVGQVGFGCLSPESVRWSSGRWQLTPVPHYAPGDDQCGVGSACSYLAGRNAGWLQDRYAIVCALVRAAVGRWPASPADARALLDGAAGDVAIGLDAVIHLLLHGTSPPGNVEPLHELHQLLGRRTEDRVTFRCFRESLVGSAKAAGRMEDNEDVAGWMSADNGSACLAILDGITGLGDGSGRDAAWAAMRAARSCWQQGKSEPRIVFSVADAEVRELVGDGGATAVFARLLPNGQGELASAGDASVWQLRPNVPECPTTYGAWRLTPMHTEYAERRHRDPGAQGGKSALTRHLGTGQQPFTRRFGVAPHDLLVLITDGAGRVEDEWFGAVLSGLAAERAARGQTVAPGLAADLVIRAERLGGEDNATALVVEVDRCSAGGARDAEISELETSRELAGHDDVGRSGRP